jgi:phage gp46-like protein
MPIPAATRRWIDPTSGDYVVENGGPRADATRASKILLRLRMRRGTCAVLPSLGSRLYLVTSMTPGAERQARAYAREAIADLIRAGEIRDVAVEAKARMVAGTASLEIEVSFTDTDGDRRSVPYTHRLGG